MILRATLLSVLAACAVLGAAACSAPVPAPPTAETAAVVDVDRVDAQVAQRLLSLDPQRISERDVREVLARVPAPRIIALHGSVPIHTMAPFAEFLAAMGYPVERLRNPGDGELTYSSFVDSREIAGAIAWHYEREGVMPLLIGHSQGGMLAVKVLQDLAGASGGQLAVWDPVRRKPEGRSSIVDPRSGEERPVIGLQVPYAAALATGRTMRVLLGQWSMAGRLRSVPDSAQEFAGYFIAWDPIAGTGPDAARTDPYLATGGARVRNVMLPSDYGHASLPLARHLAEDPRTRQWVSGFDPRVQTTTPPLLPGADLRNIVHAADIWFSVKKHWCLEAQRYVQASRAPEASPT
jgi:hypothetical protein